MGGGSAGGGRERLARVRCAGFAAAAARRLGLGAGAGAATDEAPVRGPGDAVLGMHRLGRRLVLVHDPFDAAAAAAQTVPEAKSGHGAADANAGGVDMSDIDRWAVVGRARQDQARR